MSHASAPATPARVRQRAIYVLIAGVSCAAGALITRLFNEPAAIEIPRAQLNAVPASAHEAAINPPSASIEVSAPSATLTKREFQLRVSDLRPSPSEKKLYDEKFVSDVMDVDNADDLTNCYSFQRFAPSNNCLSAVVGYGDDEEKLHRAHWWWQFSIDETTNLQAVYRTIAQRIPSDLLIGGDVDAQANSMRNGTFIGLSMGNMQRVCASENAFFIIQDNLLELGKNGGPLKVYVTVYPISKLSGG